MKRIVHFLILILFVGFTAGAFAQNAEKATAGNGKYRELVYWIKWDKRKRADGSNPGNNKRILKGDYVEFTADSGMKYRIMVASDPKLLWAKSGNMSETPKLKAGRYNNYYLNNFMNAYNWPCQSNCSSMWAPGSAGGPQPSPYEDKYISLNAQSQEIEFDLKISAVNTDSGAVIHDFAFVISGSESLNGDTGNLEESYSLAILPNEGESKLHKDQVIQPVDAYSASGDWSLKVAPEFQVISGGTTVTKTTIQPTDEIAEAKLKVTNPGGDNGQGDLLLAATHVERVRVTVKGGGGQHISLGVIDLLDFGDAPNSYETDVKNARHYTLPSLGGSLWTEEKTWKQKPNVEDFVKLEEPILGIGAVVDSENEKQTPSVNANGDDAHGTLDANGVVINDEDGVPGAKWFKDCAGPVKVHNYHETKTGYLYTWIDANNNNKFDANEKLEKIEVEPGFDGYKYFDFRGHFGTGFQPSPGDSRMMRFRISYNDNLDISDLAVSGEVEDYKIEFMVPKVEPLKETVTCDNPTTTVNITNLPQTGWTITQTGSTGPVFAPVDAGATYTGTATSTTITLAKGSYQLEISNNSPECSYIFDVVIIGDADCDGVPDNEDLDE